MKNRNKINIEKILNEIATIHQDIMLNYSSKIEDIDDWYRFQSQDLAQTSEELLREWKIIEESLEHCITLLDELITIEEGN